MDFMVGAINPAVVDEVGIAGGPAMQAVFDPTELAEVAALADHLGATGCRSSRKVSLALSPTSAWDSRLDFT